MNKWKEGKMIPIVKGNISNDDGAGAETNKARNDESKGDECSN